MNDQQIIALYFERDERAIVETNQKYGSYCYTVAHNILNNPQDSEECVNDTWLKAWNSIPPARPNHLNLFLAKITRNLSFDKYKASHSQKRGGGELPLVLDELEFCVADSRDIEGELIAKEMEQSVLAFVRNLPDQERNIFLRRYFYVESIGEIAARYALKEGNVSVILSRTRQKLQQALRKELLI